jgi:aspartate/methionine/tyrosine aminotransferase
MRNRKRGRLHGGCSTGPKTPAGRERCRQARWKHGEYSAAAKARRATMRAVLQQGRPEEDSSRLGASRGCTDSTALAERLLEEAHVVAIPGAAFGQSGEGCLRLSFGSVSGDNLIEGLDRLADFF